MPPVTRSHRRSARLRGEIAPYPSSRRSKRMRSNGRTLPRKRARLTQVQPASSKPKLSSKCIRQTKFLDLPDEAIALVFVHLGATDTGGSFSTPRHAFSLAQTNARLMCIFFSQFKRITPNILNSHPPTLRPTHLFAVILRVRHSLRELHLPKTCQQILPFIHILCPRLEKLEIYDIDEDSGFKLATVLQLPLRSLSLRYPTKTTLRLLVPRLPEELSLTKVSDRHIPDHLAPIFQNPPKRFNLEMRSLRRDKLRKLVSNLQEACTKIEELTVKLREDRYTSESVFIQAANKHLSVPRRNEGSKCRKMSLHGGMWKLIRLAHPEAVVEVSLGRQTFVNDGKNIYAKGIRLVDAYLTQDISKVTDIAVGDLVSRNLCQVCGQWSDLLADKVFSRVFVTSIEVMTYLRLKVEVVDVTISTFLSTMCSNWGWLDEVSEVRLLHSGDIKRGASEVNFIYSIGNLLDQFRGKCVFLRMFFKFRLNKKDSVLRRKVTSLARALDGFEAAGGDAGTVRAFVQHITWS